MVAIALGCGQGIESSSQALEISCSPNVEQFCELQSTPQIQYVGCCQPTGYFGISYCCPAGSICCPGPEPTDPHCCGADETCKVVRYQGNVIDQLCVPAICGGVPFNGFEQCCGATSGAPVPKNPITNLADCPDRTQTKAPDHTTPACGPAQAGPIKRAVIPQRYGPVSFEPGCIVHDECYSTCRKDKGSCDAQLRDLLLSACQAYYRVLIESALRAGSDATARQLSISFTSCSLMAEDFFGAVSTMGQDAYDTAQKDHCKCCE